MWGVLLRNPCPEPISQLGGSGVVISIVISPLIWVIIMTTLLTSPLITTPEPPSTWTLNVGFRGLGLLGVLGSGHQIWRVFWGV